jgi:hypothetical protein
MAVVTAALLGVDAAVAVHRTAGSADTGNVAAPPGARSDITPAEGVISPAASAPSVSSAAAPAEQHAARALLKQAVANALAKRSVHAVARFVTKRGTALYDNRDALHHGVQHLTIHGGHVRIRVVGSTTYYTGNRRGLIRFFTYPPKIARVIGHRWVPLIAGNRGYRVLTEGVTLGSLLHNARLVGPLRMLPARVIDGIDVVGVQGRGAGGGVPKHSIATWWISSGEHPLPVQLEAANANSQLTQHFSDWGKPVRVKRPHAIFG